MAIEIERKFLLANNNWRAQITARTRMVQGYLSSVPERTVRVRVSDSDAWLTIKGKNCGSSRSEYEYPIPVDDATEMLEQLCEKPLIDKWRYRVTDGDHQWEIDEFSGVNNGLIVAEIELQQVDEQFARPDWLGQEVTDDPRYFNSNLQSHPFCDWD